MLLKLGASISVTDPQKDDPMARDLTFVVIRAAKSVVITATELHHLADGARAAHGAINFSRSLGGNRSVRNVP